MHLPHLPHPPPHPAPRLSELQLCHAMPDRVLMFCLRSAGAGDAAGQGAGVHKLGGHGCGKGALPRGRPRGHEVHEGLPGPGPPLPPPTSQGAFPWRVLSASDVRCVVALPHCASLDTAGMPMIRGTWDGLCRSVASSSIRNGVWRAGTVSAAVGRPHERLHAAGRRTHLQGVPLPPPPPHPPPPPTPRAGSLGATGRIDRSWRQLRVLRQWPGLSETPLPRKC